MRLRSAARRTGSNRLRCYRLPARAPSQTCRFWRRKLDGIGIHGSHSLAVLVICLKCAASFLFRKRTRRSSAPDVVRDPLRLASGAPDGTPSKRAEDRTASATGFRVRFAQLSPTVRGLRAGRSRTGIANRICRIPHFSDFAAAHFLVQAHRSERGVIDSRKWTGTESAGPELLKLQFSWAMHSRLFSCRVSCSRP
jgi:hypothetical protein